jgi:N-acetylglucosaminyldiphosphoundecaprenol N-acetyl-beta-D-mannosaminyltransferase
VLRRPYTRHVSSGRRVQLIDLEIDAVTEAEAIAFVMDGLSSGQGGSVVTPNLDQLRQRVQRPELAPVFERASLVVADGMPLVWASRLQGTPLPERVAGSELVWSLTAEAALRGRSVFLLGGAPGACDAAAEKLAGMYPGLAIVGTHCPPMGFDDDAEAIERIAAMLRDTRPDIVYVALGFPKQERLIAFLRASLPEAWFLGVGYSLTFIADSGARAPDWMMGLGLEWAYRLRKEPRRLARRYLMEGLPFAARLLASAARQRLRGVRAGRDAASTSAPPPAAGADRVVFVRGSLERERARLLDELLLDP